MAVSGLRASILKLRAFGSEVGLSIQLRFCRSQEALLLGYDVTQHLVRAESGEYLVIGAPRFVLQAIKGWLIVYVLYVVTDF